MKSYPNNGLTWALFQTMSAKYIGFHKITYVILWGIMYLKNVYNCYAFQLRDRKM
jgi:hypothetical protein